MMIKYDYQISLILLLFFSIMIILSVQEQEIQKKKIEKS